MGGKVSSGSADETQQNETFFDNVQFEYRLNQGSSQFLKLFYDRDSYDWLEGQVGQYGAGFIWRRKLNHFQELFRLKDPSNRTFPTNATPQRQVIRETADTIKTTK